MHIKNIKILYIFFLILLSSGINFLYGNIGIFPIDSFAFFDTGFSILQGKHPFKDIWITTGPVVDYIQAFFFKVFGINWNSYVFHASFLNSLITICSFVFFLKNKANIHFSFICSLSIGILCYPVMGTPFAYHHAYIFSVISIYIFIDAIKYKSNLSWFLLPIVMTVSFFSMQTPSAYICLIIFLFIIIYFLKFNSKDNFRYFIFGILISSIFYTSYFLILEIPLSNFLEQYILFPISLGSNRMVGGEGAFVSLSEKMTLRGLIGHFKFIHILAIPLIYFLYNLIKTKKNNFDEDTISLSLVIISVYLFIFNQLLTANQTFIFSLIPIVGGFFYIYSDLYKMKTQKKYLNYLVLIIIIFSTIKYHNVYNSDRKFIDLQNVNLSNSLPAKQIDKKFKNLKWITPVYSENVATEINFLKKSLEILRSDKRSKMVISDYQIFSALLEEDLNIPNRWYTHDNNSYPLKNHKYFSFYEKFINNSIKSNEINVIYIINSTADNDINFLNFKNYLTSICFEDKYIIKGVISSHEIIKCK